MRHVVLLAAVLGLTFLTAPAFAEVVTVEATIKAVDAQAGTVTVITKVRSGDKTLELDVSRKASITVNGKQADLRAILVGQKATVAYDPDLEVVTKLEASGSGKPVVERLKPQLVKLSELGTDVGDPWFSDDGLTIYYSTTKQGSQRTIYMAQRDDSESLFKQPTPLFPGMMPTVTANGLRLFCLTTKPDGSSSLFEAVRDSKDKSFKRPQEIKGLNLNTPFDLAFSPDGLALYLMVSRADGSREPIALSRKTLDGPFSQTKPLLRDGFKGRMAWPFLTSDGLTMLCLHQDRAEKDTKGTLMIWRRDSTGTPFESYDYIEIKGLPPLSGRSCRFVAATKELFFTRILSQNKYELYCVKNFELPAE